MRSLVAVNNGIRIFIPIAAHNRAVIPYSSVTNFVRSVNSEELTFVMEQVRDISNLISSKSLAY